IPGCRRRNSSVSAGLRPPSSARSSGARSGAATTACARVRASSPAAGFCAPEQAKRSSAPKVETFRMCSSGRERLLYTVLRRVEAYIDEIVPAFSLAAYYEVGMKLARAAIGAAYRPLVTRPLRDLPRDATAVFLINHRSNFDYVVVGWALARQVAISYAVGEWARVFPLDALFKAFGGFFVRRGFPDPLYHTVLRRYLQLITRQ